MEYVDETKDLLINEVALAMENILGGQLRTLIEQKESTDEFDGQRL
ncbi:129_t:CDS:2, partial [Paraglomus brasilianum]